MNRAYEYIYKVIGERIPKKENFKIRKDGKYSLVLQEKVGIITSLNETAAFIITKCDGNTNINKIIDDLCMEYLEVDKSIITADVVKCVRDLEAMKILNVYS
jgi:hypothetical protein